MNITLAEVLTAAHVAVFTFEHGAMLARYIQRKLNDVAEDVEEELPSFIHRL